MSNAENSSRLAGARKREMAARAWDLVCRPRAPETPPEPGMETLVREAKARADLCTRYTAAVRAEIEAIERKETIRNTSNDVFELCLAMRDRLAAVTEQRDILETLRDLDNQNK